MRLSLPEVIQSKSRGKQSGQARSRARDDATESPTSHREPRGATAPHNEQHSTAGDVSGRKTTGTLVCFFMISPHSGI